MGGAPAADGTTSIGFGASKDNLGAGDGAAVKKAKAVTAAPAAAAEGVENQQQEQH